MSYETYEEIAVNRIKEADTEIELLKIIAEYTVRSYYRERNAS